MKDYRYNAFDDVLEPIAITGETHIIPSNSPYTIRLAEVPQKTDPSSIRLTIAGVAASEVAAQPAAGEFWPDYSTSADGDTNWNTGLIKFNAADAGKTVVAAYNGMGALASADYRGHQLFTASGTFTVPKGVKTVYVSGCGGGGGGGKGRTESSGENTYYYDGGGGGGGASAHKQPVTVVPGQSYVVTVGAAGAGGSTGTTGGASSFGSLLSLAGGGGGSQSAAGSAGGLGGGNGGYGAGGGSLYGAGGTRLLGSPGDGNNASGYGAGGGSGNSGSNSGGDGTPGFILVEW